MDVGAPIYPVGIVGTDQIQPPDAKAPRLFRSCSITVGRPVRPERYATLRERHRALRSMTDEVMFEICAIDRAGIRQSLRRQVRRGRFRAA